MTENRKQLSGGKNFFAQRGTDGVDRLIDDLAQTQSHGDAAENVCVHVAEAPTAHEQVDHAVGCRSRGGSQVGSGFYHHPGFGAAVSRIHIAGLDDGSLETMMLVEVKPQRHIQWALDSVDTDLAVSLRGMAITATEERAGIVDREIQSRARA